MRLNFKHIAALCALLLPLCMEGNAQGPVHKIKDRKRLARLRQKRVALGHKPDDHELEQQQGFSMKFHM